MKGNRYLISLATAVVFLGGCGESLEDTYSDFAGDGKIKYVAKCSNLSLTVGWKRLSLKWTNGVDAMIENIKVRWIVNDQKDSVLLAPDVTSYEIRDLVDGTYRMDVCAVDEFGTESLVETTYGRPYTENHETVRTFTKAITKFYRIGDNLVYFTDRWNNNIVKIDLAYTDLQGGEQNMSLNQDVFKKGFGILENVNTQAPLTITRLGKLEGCPDTIAFEPYKLGNERIYTSDFKQSVQRLYGFTDQTEEQSLKLEHFIDTVRVLEFDYDVNTFEDILYCSKLEKIVLGKNRYLNLTYPVKAATSVLFDEDRNIQALTAAEKLLGLKIERYNDHFLTTLSRVVNENVYTLQNVTEMGNPILADNLIYLTQSAVDTIYSSEKESASYDPLLKDLLDNNLTTKWEPSVSTSSVRTHTLTIRLKQQEMVRGIKIGQPLVDPSADRSLQYYLPGILRIRVSSNMADWTNVAYMEDNLLGQGIGEVTLFPMSTPREIMYIQVTVSDQVYANTFNVRLADIIPYR